MTDEEQVRRSDRALRIATVVDRLESAYLGAIRIIALAAATILVLFALWLAISGTFKISRDAASVKEVPATVSADDVVRVEPSRAAGKSADGDDPQAAQRRAYRDIAARYFRLFQTRFEPSRQSSDARLSAAAFDARYLRTADRLAAVRDGSIDFAQDRADLDALVRTMTEAATAPVTRTQLARYRTARRTVVRRTVSGTRQERYCSYYGYYINQCITYDTRAVPFRRQVVESRLPDGVVSHADLFGRYQERFERLLAERRGANRTAAETERARIVAGNVEGGASLWLAIRVVGGFVVLMFLFLLIALERHQRRIARLIPTGPGEAATG